jgi:hypothetical protein
MSLARDLSGRWLLSQRQRDLAYATGGWLPGLPAAELDRFETFLPQRRFGDAPQPTPCPVVPPDGGPGREMTGIVGDFGYQIAECLLIVRLQDGAGQWAGMFSVFTSEGVTIDGKATSMGELVYHLASRKCSATATFGDNGGVAEKVEFTTLD